MARRTKRLWTDEEKRSICFQTTALDISVAQVARRYAMNANLIFKWLRDPRFAPEPEVIPEAEPCFCRWRSLITFPLTRSHRLIKTQRPVALSRLKYRVVTGYGLLGHTTQTRWRG